MTVVHDPARDVYTQVAACRSCGAPVYWSLTTAGKRAPFDVDADGQPTRTNHFATCPHAAAWSKRAKP
jgi:hypothetical protein